MDKLGLYIHIPFCAGKCPYCDFYSVRASQDLMQAYTDAVCRRLAAWRRIVPAEADTLYFGGGTPSLLGGDRLTEILRAARAFGDFTEITVECNPSGTTPQLLEQLVQAGVNRISLGMQSAVDAERRALGRRAGRAEVERCIRAAKDAGIRNISLDVMLGIPRQTPQSLEETLTFCIDAGVTHVSAYLLKLEEGTFFYDHPERLDLPSDDTTADWYLRTVERLAAAGFRQYEISNFAKAGFESRHNLKYWNCEEYLGVGPAAHSFLGGERFYYPRDLDAFLRGNEPEPDGKGGGAEEYVMLRLRLTAGVSFRTLADRYPAYDADALRKRAEPFAAQGLAVLTAGGLSFTPAGFLVSNALLGKLL